MSSGTLPDFFGGIRELVFILFSPSEQTDYQRRKDWGRLLFPSEREEQNRLVGSIPE